MPRLSEVLKRFREAKGWTQRDLAKRAKITAGYIAQLEVGARKNPSLAVLRRLARAFRVPVTELLE